MLRAFRDAPLKRKLMLLVMAASVVVVMVAFLAFAISEAISSRRSLRQEITALGEIVGANTAAAVTFNDRKAAEETLSALRANPHIVATYVLSNDGRVFAKYTAKNAGRDPQGKPEPLPRPDGEDGLVLELEFRPESGRPDFPGRPEGFHGGRPGGHEGASVPVDRVPRRCQWYSCWGPLPPYTSSFPGSRG